MSIVYLDERRFRRRRSVVSVSTTTRLAGWPVPVQLSVWLRRWRLRAELRAMLLREPDSVLEDAGFTRLAAQREAHKPFWRA